MLTPFAAGGSFGSAVRQHASCGGGPLAHNRRGNRFAHDRSGCRSAPGGDSPRTHIAGRIPRRHCRSGSHHVDERHDCRDTRPACVPGNQGKPLPALRSSASRRSSQPLGPQLSANEPRQSWRAVVGFKLYMSPDLSGFWPPSTASTCTATLARSSSVGTIADRSRTGLSRCSARSLDRCRSRRCSGEKEARPVAR
jgi:hypothetical protein